MDYNTITGVRKIQKLGSISLVLLVLINVFIAGSDGIISSVTEGPLFAGGTGSFDDPYLIEILAQLQNMSTDLRAHYILINDIDASETKGWNGGFEPVGNFDTKFTGSLDGNGYNISGLYINRADSDYVGLFGSIAGGVKNVILQDVNITGKNYVGGLTGHNYYFSSTVNNSHTTGYVSGTEYVGGLVGWNDRGHVIDSYSKTEVDGKDRVGGLVGWCRGWVENSYATGDVSGSGNRIGGLVGWNHNTIENSYATGNVSGDWWVGGLAGYNHDIIDNSHASGIVSGKNRVGGLVGLNDGSGNNEGIISNSFATGDVSGDEEKIGGLVGGNIGTISNSFATGNVDGIYSVGGLVGWNDNIIRSSNATGEVIGELSVGGLVGHNYYFHSSVEDSYAAGVVNGVEYVGGLVGWNDRGVINRSFAKGDVEGLSRVGGLVGWSRGPIYNTYSNGSADGNEYVGGLVGWNTENIENSYSTGSVSGDINIGGLVGRNTGSVNNSFWDIDTSGTSVSYGGTGLSTYDMMKIDTYMDAGWDFTEIWHMIENVTYPLFQWEDLPGTTYFSLDLQAYPGSDGWNFVSLNIAPVNTSLTYILADIEEDYDRVMYYDASTARWTTHVPGRAEHFDHLKTWDQTMGLWIRVIYNTTLDVEGHSPTITEIKLYPGWNMVGYPSSTDQIASEILPPEVTKIGYFDRDAAYNIEYGSADVLLVTGEGYWIYNDAEYPVTFRV